MDLRPRLGQSAMLCCLFGCLGAACGVADPSSKDLGSAEPTGAHTEALSGTCPAGNGLFVLYYGDAPNSSEMPTLRAARPNFVVAANENPAAPDYYHFDDPVNRTGPTGIKVLAYIPMNYGANNTCDAQSGTNTQCTNLSCNGGCDSAHCVPIQTRIATAMNAGYDGVFFDETDSSLSAYNTACYNSVKSTNPSRLVITNPGVGDPDPAIFDASDIVSVENDYVSALGSYNQPSWRWLAVQGDPGGGSNSWDQPPQSLADAQARFNTFRANGGYWYYSAEPHWALEPWFTDFATWVKQQGNAPCPASYSVTVDALALDNGNAEIHPGMCVFVDGDTSHCAGFTPFTTTLTSGSHSVTLTNYQLNVFQHWDDGSTNKTRSIVVNSNATYNGYYTTR
jgi:hypothetical protein